MVTALMDDNRTGTTTRQSPVLVVELVGPACAGKTTLTRALTQCTTSVQVAPEISMQRRKHWAAFLRSAPVLLPVMLSGGRKSGRFGWEDVKSMVYVQGWPGVLKQLAANNPGLVLLDQGPVFRMTLLHAFGPDRIRKPTTDTWWNGLFKQWAAFLDLVIWLDAPNTVLVRRINARDRWHLVKGKSEREAAQFLDRYRASYRYVLTRLSANGGPRIIPFDTNQVSIDEVARAILAACELEADRD